MAKIGIVYICTGKYHIFWEGFYSSSQKHLLNEHEKQYYVFTDTPMIVSGGNIRVIYKEPQGFPMDSLLRFEMFNGIRNELMQYDYILFFNSNMGFVSPVQEEILPDKFTSGLAGVIHPGYFNKIPFWFPYERNPYSKAFIQHGQGRYRYFMGVFIGGKTASFLELSEKCAEWIREDLNNDIIAVYHDESHLNRYFLDKEILELDPGYAYPEGWDIPFTRKIIVLNKVIHGGQAFDKLPRKAYFKRFKRKISFIVKALAWYLK